MIRYRRIPLLMATLLFLLTTAFSVTALAYHRWFSSLQFPSAVFSCPPARSSCVAPYSRYQTPAPKPSTEVSSSYLAKREDTLIRIAAQFNTSVQAILAVNPQIRNPKLVRVGQHLIIPAVFAAHPEAGNPVYNEGVQPPSPPLGMGPDVTQE
jgi:LysM repeat protein